MGTFTIYGVCNRRRMPIRIGRVPKRSQLRTQAADQAEMLPSGQDAGVYALAHRLQTQMLNRVFPRLSSCMYALI
jgi:hypothetical protein